MHRSSQILVFILFMFFFCSLKAATAGSTSDIDNNFAYQTHQIYRERKLTDHFHKFAEICMER